MAMADTTSRNYGVWSQGFATAAAVTTGANTDLSSATAEPVALYTAPAGGARVTRITVVPRGNCSAAVAHLYRRSDGSTDKILTRSKAIAADTVSTTDAPVVIDLGVTEAAPLKLAGNEALYVGVSVALAAGFAWTLEAETF